MNWLEKIQKEISAITPTEIATCQLKMEKIQEGIDMGDIVVVGMASEDQKKAYTLFSIYHERMNKQIEIYNNQISQKKITLQEADEMETEVMHLSFLSNTLERIHSAMSFDFFPELKGKRNMTILKNWLIAYRK